MNADAHLSAIFDAERALRTAEAALMEQPAQDIEATLSGAVAEAAALHDRQEACLRLERLADLCAQLPGPAMADALIAILDAPEDRVRVIAGEALLDVAYDYYAEVARAIERALDDGSAVRALAELPFLLAEIGEPGGAKLLKRFLEHPSGEVVAAAIEAAVELGDPALVPTLAALEGDDRDATLDDFEGPITVGELAAHAKQALSATR